MPCRMLFAKTASNWLTVSGKLTDTIANNRGLSTDTVSTFANAFDVLLQDVKGMPQGYSQQQSGGWLGHS